MHRETFIRTSECHARAVQEAMRVIQPRMARAASRGVISQLGAAMKWGL